MIPFSPPKIYQEIIDEVTDTLRSGWITTGPKTKQFERDLSDYTGADATLCLNSATAGLELMIRWFGVKEGDEVIVPAYTYCASANVILHCGAKPVMVDVEDDFNISVSAVKQAITARTKVIIPVDFAGWPCDYQGLNELVESPEVKSLFQATSEEQKILGRILILSDAAHSLGATSHGKRTGSLTDVSVFSFHAVKNLTTAEGGAVSLCLPQPFDNTEIYKALCVKSLHGQNKDALTKTTGGGWQYDVIEAGYKWNMTDIQASMGIVELRRYEAETLNRRREIFETYHNGLQKCAQAILPVFENAHQASSYHLYPLRIDGVTEDQRNAIIQRIIDKGVSVNVHFPPLPLLTVYKSLGYDIADYPNAYALYSSEISLPVYYSLTDDQVEQVIEAVVTSIQEELEV